MSRTVCKRRGHHDFIPPPGELPFDAGRCADCGMVARAFIKADGDMNA